MSHRVLAWVAAGALAVLAGVVVLITSNDPAPAAGGRSASVQTYPEAERTPLPDFAGEAVREGEPRVDLSEFRGAPLVVNVWASWCGPCRAEQRGLLLASQELADEGVRFVGVNVRDDRAAARAYLEEFQVTYPSIYDRESRFVAKLGDHAPLAPPYTLVVDAEGRIAARIIGVLPGGDDPRVQAAELERLVAEVTAPAGQATGRLEERSGSQGATLLPPGTRSLRPAQQERSV